MLQFIKEFIGSIEMGCVITEMTALLEKNPY